jgi:cytochrome c oxidase subunit 2
MAPVLQGLYGKEVEIQGGQKVLFDEAYIRESILNPTAKITAGYQPVMPTFQGQVTEDAIMQLIAYIKSLGGAAGVHSPAAKATGGTPTESPAPTEGHVTSPAPEEPAATPPPADAGQTGAGTDTPTNPQTEPPAGGTHSPNEEQTM